MDIKKVLVSQPRPSSDKSPYFDIEKKYGVEITFRPLIKVEGLSAKEFRQQKVNIADFTAVIFTSKAAIDHFFHLCEDSRVAIPDTMKYFCTTESIAHYLQKYIVYRKRKIFFGTTGKLDDPHLIQAFNKNVKEKFIYPISDLQIEDLPGFEAAKIKYTKAVMYRTVSNDFSDSEPFDYDVIIFFSPAGIRSLLKNFPDFVKEKKNVYVGCLGPTTAKAVEEAGLNLAFSAPTPATPSITSALEAFLKEEQKKD